ncbi:MAG: queuosine precursor transporter [Candidatus Protistobacter heckmanni]|nr:queuosine precursor transporter [Candidatus Protistobacter heckmanni]
MRDESQTGAPPASGRSYRYYDFVMAAFVTVLLCSNLIGAGKAAEIELPLLGTVAFGAGVLFFPISYIFGDVLTEVYGYGRDRRVVWAGFGALVFAAVMSWVVIALPPAGGDYMRNYQGAMETVFSNTWRIVAGSMIAFWCGSFANSYVLAKMKIWTQGRSLWTRTIGSTIVGEAVDSSLLYVIAFYGIWPSSQVLAVALSQYVFKTLWEVVMTPVTYRVVGFLKKHEHEDYYDCNTDFNPFKLRT